MLFEFCKWTVGDGVVKLTSFLIYCDLLWYTNWILLLKKIRNGIWQIEKIPNVLIYVCRCTYIDYVVSFHPFHVKHKSRFSYFFWDFCLLNCFCHICDDNALSIQTMATFMAHGIVMGLHNNVEFYFGFLSHNLSKKYWIFKENR